VIWVVVHMQPHALGVEVLQTYGPFSSEDAASDWAKDQTISGARYYQALLVSDIP